MFFGKQKFDVKQLKLNKFIFDVKQLKTNKFTFEVKQLKMERFLKSIWLLVLRMLHLRYPRYAPAKEVIRQYWDKVLIWVRKACYRYWWMFVTFEWILPNISKLFTIFYHRGLCWKMVSHNGVFIIQWYLKNQVMSVMDFCFENADTKGRNLDYVLWLGMVISALMLLSRIYLRRLSSSSRDIS